MTQTKVWDGSQWLALPPGPVGPKGAKGDTGDTGGSLAMRWDETVGRRLFVQKDAGEQMVYGDTGWRDIKASSIGTPPVVFDITRSMWRVECRVYKMDATSEVPIPLGFRPYDAGDGSSYPVGTTTLGAMLWNAGTGRFVPAGAVVGYTPAFLYLSYLTADAWPTALPGNPVGGIPSGA